MCFERKDWYRMETGHPLGPAKMVRKCLLRKNWYGVEKGDPLGKGRPPGKGELLGRPNFFRIFFFIILPKMVRKRVFEKKIWYGGGNRRPPGGEGDLWGGIFY